MDFWTRKASLSPGFLATADEVREFETCLFLRSTIPSTPSSTPADRLSSRHPSRETLSHATLGSRGTARPTWRQSARHPQSSRSGSARPPSHAHSASRKRQTCESKNFGPSPSPEWLQGFLRDPDESRPARRALAREAIHWGLWQY